MTSDTISIWRRLGFELSTMHRSTKRLRVSEVNPHLICVLCGGYYIDATTIIECLHTFCKTCIVGYLEASKHCPVCDNLVHKNKPHLRLRPDHALQDLVYKLVPGLFKDEMSKRRQFYQDEIESGKLDENGSPEERERIIYSADEQISLILEMSPDGQPPVNPGYRSTKHNRLEAADRRYLLCPANITIGHLKKFVKMKFNVCDRFQIDFYHTDESLHDHYTLVDVAYIYSWRRQGPLRLYYSVYTNPAKKFKEDVVVDVPMELDSSKCVDEKTETSGYISDDEKPDASSITVMEVSNVNESNVSESGIESMNESNTCELEIVHQKPKSPVDTLHTDNDTEESDINVNGSSEIEKLPETVQNNNGAETVVSAKEAAEPGKSEERAEVENEQVTNEINCSPVNVSCQSQTNTNETDSTVVAQTEALKKDIVGVVEFDATDNEKTKTVVESVVTGTATETSSKAEASTSTSPTPVSEKQEIIPASAVASKDNIKSNIKEQEVSEPVVSSTQNTQACQTEPPDSSSEPSKVQHSPKINISSVEMLSHKNTVDVSCETDNIVLSRQQSKERVSVSTETECEKSDTSRKLVDCSTDVYDFPESESIKMHSIDCSTDAEEFQVDLNKHVSLTVDCTTDMGDLDVNSDRRKSFSSAIQTEDRAKPKVDIKTPKRSISYSGHHTVQKAEYLAKPLSPTKITLKFSAPKQPSPTGQKSLSRAETTGFQSQYQSFVRDLPDTSYDFVDDDESQDNVKHTGSKYDNSKYKHTIYSPVPSLSIPKKQSKSGRPRGRPPKNKSADNEYYVKEKKHKSRSHSPKHRKHSDKSDKHSDKHGEKRKAGHSPSGVKLPPGSTPYSWINKLDGDAKSFSERKNQKVKLDMSSKSTTAAASTPSSTSSDLKIPKQILYLSNGQYTLATPSTLNALKQSSPQSPTQTVSETHTSSYGDKHSQSEKSKEKKVHKLISNKGESKSLMDKKIYRSKSEVSKHDFSSERESKTDSIPPNVFKIDSNQNKIVTSSVTCAGVSSVSSSEPKDTQTPTTSIKSPEYRHQSPFFASFSGAKLGTQRTNTHLNIPNLSSHFSGTHQLYSQNRYLPDRLGQPVFRSLSLGDKTTTTTVMDTKIHDKFSIESVRSPCTFLPFTSPYLAFPSHLHAHPIPSLPCNVSPKGYSPDSTRSPTNTAVESHSHVSNNAAKSMIKPGTVSRKGKEKSIDTIISAITEMRAKKESSAQEQLNGIDLSTKSSRQKEKSGDSNRGAVDKYAFTDEEESKQKLRFKTEPMVVEQKSAL